MVKGNLSVGLGSVRTVAAVVALGFVVACQQTGSPATNSVDTSGASNGQSTANVSLSSPPKAARVKYTAEYHGMTLRDDYHWLRDPAFPTVADPKILDYLNQENAYFDAWMRPHQPLVTQLFEELKGRQPQADESVPYQDGKFIFQSRFDSGSQYRSWYWAPANAPANWRLLLDENELAKGRSYFNLGAWAVSPNGETLVYSADTSGDEHYRIYLVDLASGERYDYSIQDNLGDLIWAPDSRSFFYLRLDTGWRAHEAWRHRLRAVSGGRGDDELIYRENDKRFRLGLTRSASRDYLLIDSGTHTTNEVRTMDIDRDLARPSVVALRQEGKRYQVDHRGDRFYILTNDTHPNFRLVQAPASDPSPRNWQTVVAPSGSVYLSGMQVFQNHLVVLQRNQGLDQVRVLDAQHRAHLIEFPESVYTVGLGDNKQYRQGYVRLAYESMVTPDTVFDYDLDQRRLLSRKVQEIPSGYEPTNYTSERIMVTARDGVQVPVSLVRHIDYVADGTAPLWLYGYGAYGRSIPPGFSSTRLSMLDRGVAFAIAHIRGGDDLGEAWYQAGKLEERNNTFNDFVDVARYLASVGYGKPGNIAISGGSAGGTLMGAVVNQAPELWGVVATQVPFVDVLNTMLDETLPLTPPEWAEWGNPIKDAQAYRFIQSYSPYDQLKEGGYPPMFVSGGLNDQRVTYWEPAKYVAKLRSLKQDQNALLLKINMGAGHGGNSGRYTRLQEVAEEYAFFLQHLQGTKEVN